MYLITSYSHIHLIIYIGDELFLCTFDKYIKNWHDFTLDVELLKFE